MHGQANRVIRRHLQAEEAKHRGCPVLEVDDSGKTGLEGAERKLISPLGADDIGALDEHCLADEPALLAEVVPSAMPSPVRADVECEPISPQGNRARERAVECHRRNAVAGLKQCDKEIRCASCAQTNRQRRTRLDIQPWHQFGDGEG